jgi:hypothetical protein
MQAPLMTKYIFQIRSRNGAVVDNLQIYGQNVDEARRKLNQMYMHCMILDERIAMPERLGGATYEDVLNLIIERQ